MLKKFVLIISLIFSLNGFCQNFSGIYQGKIEIGASYIIFDEADRLNSDTDFKGRSMTITFKLTKDEDQKYQVTNLQVGQLLPKVEGKSNLDLLPFFPSEKLKPTFKFINNSAGSFSFGPQFEFRFGYYNGEYAEYAILTGQFNKIGEEDKIDFFGHGEIQDYNYSYNSASHQLSFITSKVAN